MKKKRPGTVRIIGGQWRGRRLPVTNLPGLRPSGDRGRETLFNWLQAAVRKAVCVDLFAGTGALGLEAASRGAEQVFLVEKSAVAARMLRQNLELLSAGQCSVIESDAITWLSSCEPDSLDIVFIDPPFGLGLEARVLTLIHERGLLRGGGWVYVETSRDCPLVPPAPDWEISRQKTLGEVQMTLLKKI